MLPGMCVQAVFCVQQEPATDSGAREPEHLLNIVCGSYCHRAGCVAPVFSLGAGWGFSSRAMISKVVCYGCVMEQGNQLV